MRWRRCFDSPNLFWKIIFPSVVIAFLWNSIVLNSRLRQITKMILMWRQTSKWKMQWIVQKVAFYNGISGVLCIIPVCWHTVWPLTLEGSFWWGETEQTRTFYNSLFIFGKVCSFCNIAHIVHQTRTGEFCIRFVCITFHRTVNLLTIFWKLNVRFR